MLLILPNTKKKTEQRKGNSFKIVKNCAGKETIHLQPIVQDCDMNVVLSEVLDLPSTHV